MANKSRPTVQEIAKEVRVILDQNQQSFMLMTARYVNGLHRDHDHRKAIPKLERSH
jgi:hypothetical protein